eukprot:10970421-Alexandrium_andersonii.AAC.1
MRQQTGRPRWPSLALQHAGAPERCSSSTRLTSLAALAAEARPNAACLLTAWLRLSGWRRTAG